ncbi:MAG: hypothetical protein V4773_17850 [Verrucomicrobiota bacterium]
MRAVAVTLFEGNYHLGAAGLINSLHTAGFTGTFVCGYRGAIPPWADRTLPFEVKFLPLTVSTHLTNYKPTFLQQCLREFGLQAEQLYYFDPDIVVKAPWSTLERWASDGLAIVEDVNAYLPTRHPYRLAWADFFAHHKLPVRRSIDRYFNAGFFGLPRAHLEFLTVWQRLLDLAAATNGGERLKHGQPHTLFHSADQDAMNMALMLSDIPINSAGPEAMDFTPGGHLLSHAAGGTKPWRGGFLRAALAGRPPSAPQKAFFHYVDSPIPVFSPSALKILKLELACAAAIGRFYRRN